MCGRVALSLVSLIIALLAVFLALPSDDYLDISEYQDTLRDYLGPVISLFSTCPFHGSQTSSSEGKYVNADGSYHVIRTDATDQIFTKEDLAQYGGTEGSLGLYLGILGLVYDVSKGQRFYEPGGGYGFFAGDACGFFHNHDSRCLMADANSGLNASSF